MPGISIYITPLSERRLIILADKPKSWMRMKKRKLYQMRKLKDEDNLDIVWQFHTHPDSKEELQSIAKAVNLVVPDRVYVVTPIRPPAESWVEPPAPETIIMAQELIGKAIPIVSRESGQFGSKEFGDARQAILEIGSRHPLRQDQATEIEAASGGSGIVDQMLRDRELIRTIYGGAIYLLPGHFIRGKSNHGKERRQRQ